MREIKVASNKQASRKLRGNIHLRLNGFCLVFLLLMCLSCGSSSSDATNDSAKNPTTLLVDFGATVSENKFGLSGWNTVIKSSHSNYSNAGSGGMVMVSGTSEYDGYYGITGAARVFSSGERIAVTWYNKGNSSIDFNPIVSFKDDNNPVNTEGEPQWYPMSRNDDIYGYDIDVAPGQFYTTVYDITEEAVAGGNIEPTAGSHMVVNISPRTTNQDLICDKIEIIDADQTPPSQPQNVNASVVSISQVDVNWDVSSDNVAVKKYKVYLNGLYHGWSKTTSYTIYNLTPSTEYDITVTAIDGFLNESPHSSTSHITTQIFPSGSNLINPKTDIEYKGAFRMPEDTENSGWGYRSGTPAYYPRTTGDPSPDDGYPGSLFAGGHIYDRYVAEIAVPEPIISATKNASELNLAQTVQDFYDITFPGPPDFSYYYGVSLGYLPAQGTQTSGKLYTVYGNDYSIAGNKYADHGASELDLSNPNAQGRWYVGDSAQWSVQPPYNSTYKYLFEIPGAWADEHAGGRCLVTGGNRVGNYPNGPAMYAIGPWVDGGPLPQDKTELSYVTLLQYEDNRGTHYLNGQDVDGDDGWEGGAWLTSGDKSAAIITGEKAFGDLWYGFSDGTPAPYPHLHVPDPGEWEGHSPRSSMSRSMMLFYDPADLEDVANGIKQSYEPQPYAALDMSEYAFDGFITETAYDRQRNILYIIENNAYGGGAYPIVHVFKINE